MKKFIFTMLAAISCAVPLLHASATGELRDMTPDDFKRLHADSWRVVGRNIIIEGNAYLPAGSLEIFADRIILNMDSHDFEAIGNITVFRWQNGSGTVSLESLAQLERRANVLIREVNSSVSVLGERSYTVSFAFQTDRISADRLTGNLKTGFFEFINPVIRYATFVCKAASGTRTSDGVITLKDGEISSCEFLESDNAHYSVAAGEIRLTPHEAKFYELKYADFDPGDRSILLINGFVKVYGIPVLWLPVFFKPKDENPGIAGFQYGHSGDLGYYINLYRRINFSDAPGFTAKIHADWYEKRGFGYGISGRVAAPESRTDFFAYSIYDTDRYESADYDDFRLKVPHWRYDFRISNLSHITPRLDFRGVFDYQSDPYFKRDFFRAEYNRDPLPATFAALEQQFDNFSLSAYSRFRMNDFYTAVERIPEVRLDIPRQEIFNTGIYYQGEAEMSYLRRKWIDFDYPPPAGFSRLHDYDAARFDTTHFLYYPVTTQYFTLVPRAGFRITAYSDSSKTKVYEEDLQAMFSAAEPQSLGRYRFRNYDSRGDSKVRFAMELGFELSTKLHNTWQDLRSEFFQLDGLRHIIQPYVNYTFIPKPTVDRKKLYFFDDVDRITKQNFFRLGMVNRLQTRSGNAVKDILYMENFWDLHLEKVDGISQIGNVGTLLSWNIFKGLSLNTEFLIDVSGDGETEDTIRHGRNAGKTGLAVDWLNYWDINLAYSPAANWQFVFGYNYVRPYEMRSSYSMGSTLTQINAASYFQQYTSETDENFYLRVNMPLTPDDRTFGSFLFTYDVQEGSIDEVSLAVMRQFHCWQLVATVGMDREYDSDDGEWNWDVEYSISANLTGLNDAMNNVQNTVLRQMDSLVTNLKF
ncbi:MAG: LPS-assembly protein LptD [Lentisphaeria bacterium]|nr:LPS-assembly protein LptD [Lentisphaeria bacterium]